MSSNSAEEIKQAIIDSAVKLFEKYGYKNVRIAQITDEIAMTTGAFYYYFRSKEEILQLIYDYYITLAVEMIKVICESSGVPANDKLNLAIRNHCKAIKDYHSHVSVFFREYRNLSQDGLDIIQKKNSRFLSLMSGLITQGVQEGVFRNDLNPKIVSMAIIGMCNWIFQWYNDAGELSIEEIGQIFSELIASGLHSK